MLLWPPATFHVLCFNNLFCGDYLSVFSSSYCCCNDFYRILISFLMKSFCFAIGILVLPKEALWFFIHLHSFPFNTILLFAEFLHTVNFFSLQLCRCNTDFIKTWKLFTIISYCCISFYDNVSFGLLGC